MIIFAFLVGLVALVIGLTLCYKTGQLMNYLFKMDIDHKVQLIFIGLLGLLGSLLIALGIILIGGSIIDAFGYGPPIIH